jgi:hypothetical protein
MKQKMDIPTDRLRGKQVGRPTDRMTQKETQIKTERQGRDPGTRGLVTYTRPATCRGGAFRHSSLPKAVRPE